MPWIDKDQLQEADGLQLMADNAGVIRQFRDQQAAQAAPEQEAAPSPLAQHVSRLVSRWTGSEEAGASAEAAPAPSPIAQLAQRLSSGWEDQAPTAASGTPAAMPTSRRTLSNGQDIGSIDMGVSQAGTRAARFAREIAQVSAEEGVPQDVLAAIIDTEDSGEDSVSTDGARGLTQVVPGQGFDLPGEDASDPLTSIRQSARALKEKQRMAGGDWRRAGGLYFGQGSDSNGVTSDDYQQRFDQNRARYQGNGAFQQVTVAPNPQSSGQPDIAQAALDDPDKWSLCGPVAAVIAATRHGAQWTVAQAKRIAQGSNLWDAGNGMHGLQSEVDLLNSMNVSARTGQADQQSLAADAAAGNTPIVSTNKHYFILTNFDPDTGKFDTTTTGTALASGSQQLTLSEIERLGGGIQGAAYIDNPTSPTPSVVATPTKSAAGGNVQKIAAAGQQLPADGGPGAGDQKRSGLAAAQDQLYRQPIAPTQGPDTTTGQEFDPRDADNGPHEGAQPDLTPADQVNPTQTGTLRPTDLPADMQGARPWLTPGQQPQSGIQVTPDQLDQMVPRGAQTNPVTTNPETQTPDLPAQDHSVEAGRGRVHTPTPIEQQAADAFNDDSGNTPGPSAAERAISSAGNSRFLNEPASRQATDITHAMAEAPQQAYTRARRELISDDEARRQSGTDPVAPFRPLATALLGRDPFPSSDTLNPDRTPASDIAGGVMLASLLPIEAIDPVGTVGFMAAGGVLRRLPGANRWLVGRLTSFVERQQKLDGFQVVENGALRPATRADLRAAYETASSGRRGAGRPGLVPVGGIVGAAEDEARNAVDTIKGLVDAGYISQEDGQRLAAAAARSYMDTAASDAVKAAADTRRSAGERSTALQQSVVARQRRAVWDQRLQQMGDPGLHAPREAVGESGTVDVGPQAQPEGTPRLGKRAWSWYDRNPVGGGGDDVPEMGLARQGSESTKPPLSVVKNPSGRGWVVARTAPGKPPEIVSRHATQAEAGQRLALEQKRATYKPIAREAGSGGVDMAPEDLLGAYARQDAAAVKRGGQSSAQGGMFDSQPSAPDAPASRSDATASARDVQTSPAGNTPAEQPTKHEYSSTQLDLPKKLADTVRTYNKNAIAAADLAHHGRETEPHVTVKYGLHTADPEAVRSIVEAHPPITVTLGKTSVFPASETGGEFDVVKADVDSPDLHALNAKLAKLPNGDTHPTYTPHVTLAYVKPGAGAKYKGSKKLAGQTVTIDSLTFSGKDGKQVQIPLAGGRPTARSESADITHPEAKSPPGQAENGRPAASPEIRQAFADWNGGRAYVDDRGNYHVKRPGKSAGPIAPWSRAVRRAYPDSGAFHAAATSPSTEAPIAREAPSTSSERKPAERPNATGSDSEQRWPNGWGTRFDGVKTGDRLVTGTEGSGKDVTFLGERDGKPLVRMPNGDELVIRPHGLFLPPEETAKPNPWEPTEADRAETARQDAEVAQRPPHSGYLEEGPAEGGGDLHGPTGHETMAIGTTDATRQYPLRWRAVELDDLTASHTNALAPNPDFPQELQPRDRGRAATRAWLADTAAKFSPQALLTDTKSLQTSAPIVTNGGTVLSGNGRVLLLRRLAANEREKYTAYRTMLEQRAGALGFDPSDIAGMRQPVLVRESLIDFADDKELAEFAHEANADPTLQMGVGEKARADARLIDAADLARLVVPASGDLAEAIKAGGNRDWLRDVAGRWPASERGAFWENNGDPSSKGVAKLKSAIFARLFGGEYGARIQENYLESAVPENRALGGVLEGALLDMAKLDGQVATGKTDQRYAVGERLARALLIRASAKNNGVPLSDELAKLPMPGVGIDAPDALTVSLVHLVDRMVRTPARLREVLQEYARLALQEPPPGQGMMFESREARPETEVLDDAARSVAERQQRPSKRRAAPSDNGGRPARQAAPAGPRSEPAATAPEPAPATAAPAEQQPREVAPAPAPIAPATSQSSGQQVANETAPPPSGAIAESPNTAQSGAQSPTQSSNLAAAEAALDAFRDEMYEKHGLDWDDRLSSEDAARQDALYEARNALEEASDESELTKGAPDVDVQPAAVPPVHVAERAAPSAPSVPESAPAAPVQPPAATAPPAQPPVVPPPPTATTPEPEPGKIRGFGWYEQNDEAGSLLRRVRGDYVANDLRRVPMAETRAAAEQVLGLDAGAIQRWQDDILAEGTEHRGQVSDALRLQAYADERSAIRAASRLAAAQERLRGAGEAGAGALDEQAQLEAADALLEATEAVQRMQRSGRASTAEGTATARALAQRRGIVLAGRAWEMAERARAVANEAEEGAAVAKRAGESKGKLGKKGREQLRRVRDRLAGPDGKRLTEGDGTDGRLDELEQRAAKAKRERSKKDGEAATPKPAADREESLAERLGKLKRQHGKAEDAGDTAEVAKLDRAMQSILDEIRADAIQRTGQEAARTKEPLTIEQAERAVNEALGRNVVNRMRREERDRIKGRAASDLAAAVDRALKKVEADQRRLLDQIDIQTQRRLEKAFAAEKRAEVRQQVMGLAEEARTWMARVHDMPNQPDLREELDFHLRVLADHSTLGQVTSDALREQFATQLDENAFKFQADVEKRVADAARKEAERLQREMEASQIRGTVGLIDELLANPDGPGTVDRWQELQSDLAGISTRGFDKASSIRKRLFQANLYRAGLASKTEDVTPLVEAFANIERRATQAKLDGVPFDERRALRDTMRILSTPSLWDLLREMDYINLLSSPITNLVNASSNLANISGRMFLAAPLEGAYIAAANRDLRRLGEVGAAFSGAGKGLGKGRAEAGEIMRTGVSNDDMQRALETGDVAHVSRELLTERFGLLGAVAHTLITRPLEAVDEMIGTTAWWSGFQQHAAREAYRMAERAGVWKGKPSSAYQHIMANPWDYPDVVRAAGKIKNYTILKGPAESALEEVVDRSISALRSPRQLAERQAGVMKKLGARNPSTDPRFEHYLIAALSNWIVPFYRTPSKFFQQGLDKTIAPVAAPIRAGMKARRGELTEDEAARYFQRALIGGAVMLTAAILAAGDNLTADGPTDADDRLVWAATHEPNSYRVPGVGWLSWQGTPWAIPFATVASMKEEYDGAVKAAEKKGARATGTERALAVGKGVVKGTVQGILSQSFIQNVQSTYNAVAGQSGAESLAANTITRPLPVSSFWRWMARVGDHFERDIRAAADPESGLTVVPRIMAQIPGLREQLPPANNMYGEPIENQQYRPMGALPYYRGHAPLEGDPITEKVQAAGVGMPQVDNYLSGDLVDVPKTKVPLTAMERYRYQQVYGQAYRRRLEAVGVDRKNLNAEQITDLRGQALKTAQELMVREIGAVEARRRIKAAMDQAKRAS